MMRNLKILGLVLVAVLAMGVMTAASAQAAPEFTAFNTAKNEHEGGQIKGSAIGTQVFKATSESSLSLECTEMSTEASTASGTETALTFSNIVFQGGHGSGTCKTNPLNTPVHTYMNDCHLEATTTLKLNEGEYEGGAHLKCTGATKHITIEVTTSGGGATKCTITIGEQTIGPIVYRNKEAGGGLTDVEVEFKAKNVINTTAGGVLNCGVGNGEHKEGAYEGKVTGKGFNAAGTQIERG